MLKVNKNYQNIKQSYLFADIASRVSKFVAENPDKKVIKMGIGDVTLPLCEAVTDGLTAGVNDMKTASGFHGYGPEQGYDFLKESIRRYYATNNVDLELNEIFISDGAKSDLGNILDIFAKDNVVLIPDPVYPVYVDTNVMDGRQIVFLKSDAENGFLPMPDNSIEADIIYLCSPNNPTGAVYSRSQLTKWVDYANSMGAVILFDAAYEAFVEDTNMPRSIFEIENARTCAIEFCSFSKTAGFTGTRCGYTIVPNQLSRDDMSLNKMWLRRQTTKFNGVPYVVQRGAEQVFTSEGMKEVKDNIAYYKRNAKLLTDTLDKLKIWYTGGKNSPYVWFKCPNDMKSWEFFDFLLEKANVVGTPGEGFGENGEGFFRLTAFGSYDNTIEAMKRMEVLLKK